MASSGRAPNTNTTTTTNTTVTITRNPRPRDFNHTQNLSASSTSSRQPLYEVRSHGAPAPQPDVSDSHISEPFPSIRVEPPHSPQLSQWRSADGSRPPNTLTTVSSRTSTTAARIQARRRPIGIKRISAANVRFDPETSAVAQSGNDLSSSGRRRSTSEPQRPTLIENAGENAPLQHSTTVSSRLPALVEGRESVPFPELQDDGHELQDRPEHRNSTGGITRSRAGSQRLRRVSDAARSAVSRLSNRSDEIAQPEPEYDEKIVDILDVLDPEVSTLTTLTNVQNSLFVPDLGRWLNRRPTFELTQGPSYRHQRPTLNRGTSKPLPPTPTPMPPPPKDVELRIPSEIGEESSSNGGRESRLSLVPSIASVVQEEHYAVLPHGVSLDGWSQEEKELLDDHVRHMLHSKREGFKRSMRAFGKYVRKPLGFFVTLYAVLITLFGLAWVLFLIGWIYVGDRQPYIINVVDNVLVALFAIVGDGLAPFRAVDTYHMAFIAYYHNLTKKIREKRALPKLQDHNELPEVHETEVDVEASLKEGDAEFSVLTPEQQRKLEHHQEKFSNSHSFYKPHETTTHNAFPHHLFVAIVILLDMHSCLQIALGACTWGIYYKTRPEALTPTILSCSITVNITAGILIKVGDNKTRKKDVLKRMFRQELTEEAMRKIEKEKGHEKSIVEIQREKGLSGDRIEEDSEEDRLSTPTTTQPSRGVQAKS